MTRWKDDQILDAIRAWTTTHGHAPLASDWTAATQEHPERSTVSRRFGSWANALDAAGVARARQAGTGRGFGRFSKDAILDLLDEWTAEHGAPPRVMDWNPSLADHHGYPDVAARFRGANGHWPWSNRVTDLFGTWNAALAAAEQRSTQSGLKRTTPRAQTSAPGTHTHAWTKTECISAIHNFHAAHGRGPGAHEWDEADPTGQRPSRRTLLRLFGSMRAAVEASEIDAAYLRAGPRTGRPPRQVHDPDLEARIAANRQQTDHAEQVLKQRRNLAIEALAASYPIRRVAELTGLHRSAIERLAAHRD